MRSRYGAGFALVVAATVSCGRSSASATDGGVASDASLTNDAATPPEDPHVTDLWTWATDGGADDLARLARELSVDALVLSTLSPARRVAALRALAYSGDFVALPTLAKVATTGTDEEANAALESAAELAARPRRATDPEDAMEIREGTDALLALAKDDTRPLVRRALAVRALRMLADRGYLPDKDLPSALAPTRKP